MQKKGRLWVKPGHTTRMLSYYEKQRAINISNNQAKMEALGLHHVTNSLKSVVQNINQTSLGKKGKIYLSEQDDEEYRPLEGEEDLSSSNGDDDSDDHNAFDPRMAKVPKMTSVNRSSHRSSPHREVQVPNMAFVNRSSHCSSPHTEGQAPSMPSVNRTSHRSSLHIEGQVPNMASVNRSSHRSSPPTEGQDLANEAFDTQLHILQPVHSQPSSEASASTRKRVRGFTVRKKTEKIVRQSGKLPVEIPKSDGALVGLNASTLGQQIGIEVRNGAPLQNVTCWDEIDPSTREAIIQRVRDKFEIVGYDDDEKVRNTINTKCQRRYSNWKSAMHTHYMKLLKDGVDPKSKPYHGVLQADWEYMIDITWPSDKFKNLSEKNKVARAHLPWNHACGSRSFVATMSLEENDGVRPDIADFYKRSHWSKRKNDWVNEKCGEIYEDFKRVKERCSQPDAVPMSQEGISIEVLGKKSGYLRGFGVGPKPSSSRSIALSLAHDKEMMKMTEEISSLRELNVNQKKEFDDFKAYTMQILVQAGLLQTDHGGGESSSGGDEDEDHN